MRLRCGRIKSKSGLVHFLFISAVEPLTPEINHNTMEMQCEVIRFNGEVI